MSKDQIVSDAVAALQAAEVSVLGGVYDSSFAEGAASVPPADADEQVKIDAAVAVQKAADQSIIDGLNGQLSDLQAKDAADLQAASDAQAALALLQGQFNDLSAKEGIESGVIANLQGSLSQLQNAVSILSGLPLPAPAAQ